MRAGASGRTQADSANLPPSWERLRESDAGVNSTVEGNVLSSMRKPRADSTGFTAPECSSVCRARLPAMGTRWLSISLVVLFSATALHADVLDARKTFLRARTAVADGDYREALELYRKVIQDLPGDAVVRYEYAQLLRDLNVTDEAIKQAQETVKLDPSMPEGHRLLGALEFAAAGKDPVKLDRAIAELQQAQRLTPDDASTSVALARALLARDGPEMRLGSSIKCRRPLRSRR